MNTNNHNNEKKNTITRRMKIAHNSLPETDRKAHMEPKWRELADIRSKMFAESKKQLKERGIQLKEKSKAQQQESFEREKELMEEEFQVQRELLEIYYGYPTQKNKPGIKYDDTIDIEPEDEKD
ncbi:hypothetical protein ACR9JN_02475 [Helicobacter pylori]|uniref:Putative n=1 Tax=Helicobacter pylori (strain J99 / ATCC 700824) TaxID=85963 RepID=Q9ZJV1_HELPJ|nr:hypothetical protein [Helicobacter pylori]AAD06776.1 putative [Helicobacter pylori J99]AKE82259.1 hypothetical protein YH61_06470 [Helicobacter pylori J99]AVL48352.1 hypothetical protein CEP79_01855 [Helicobacter pylori]EMG98631.1 hypothetical protein HMPREF1404_01152 [Helicobacter pylori GAM210Bi]MUU27593.1 hypothetical protein [Helicobacter pylori]